MGMNFGCTNDIFAICSLLANNLMFGQIQPFYKESLVYKLGMKKIQKTNIPLKRISPLIFAVFHNHKRNLISYNLNSIDKRIIEQKRYK